MHFDVQILGYVGNFDGRNLNGEILKIEQTKM
jgi:hypothetical protein